MKEPDLLLCGIFDRRLRENRTGNYKKNETQARSAPGTHQRHCIASRESDLDESVLYRELHEFPERIHRKPGHDIRAMRLNRPHTRIKRAGDLVIAQPAR